MSRRISITVSKASKGTPLGVSIQDENGMIIIGAVRDTSPFYGNLSVGYQIISIDGVSMAGKTITDAAGLLKEAEGKVTVEARTFKMPLKPIVASVVESTIEDLPVEQHPAALGGIQEEIQLEAPEDLPQGFEMEAEWNGALYVAIVPAGGIKQGELLTAELKADQPIEAPQPPSGAPRQQQQTQQGTEEPLVVEFVAPCDLPESCEVEVEIDGKPRIAIVPLGGAKKGETVTATVAPAQPSASDIPLEPALAEISQDYPGAGLPVAAEQPLATTVEFVAPCDLPQGSEVEVEIDGKLRIAIVPLGGAREGETVTATVAPEQQSSPSPAYTGSTTSQPKHQGVAIPEGAPPFAPPIVAQSEWVDPENPQGYQLTLFRKQKNHQGCHTWKLSANGDEIGSLPNGGSLAVRGNVGDKLELHMGRGCKVKANTFEMIIKRPGKLNIKLKQAGDVTYWILMTVCLISMFATAAGFVLGLIPLLLGLAAGSTAFYKYCKAGWREITPCETGNEDLRNGSIVRVTTRGCCG